MIAYEQHRDASASEPDGGPEIEHGGERMPLLMSGRASVPQRGALGRAQARRSSSTTSTRAATAA